MKNLKDFDFPGKKVVYAAWVVAYILIFVNIFLPNPVPALTWTGLGLVDLGTVYIAVCIMTTRGGREYRGALLGLCVIAVGITWIAATLFRT